MLEKINQFLNTEFAQKIINEQEFFFQKGQDALNKWLTYPVDVVLEKELLELASDYEGIQKRAKESIQINDILKLLFEITSYCDTKAKDKNLYNQYDDKRTLAMAYVRMNHWIEKLILFKFNRTLVPIGSLLNAFNYLLDPGNNATILSENHREMISKKVLGKDYNPSNFIEELKDYFSEFGLTTINQNNYTYLLSCIIYFIKKNWLDDIIGLMAADNTDWKDDLINDMGEDDYAILWNSRTPTGTNETIKMLRNKINNGEFFKLFYAVHGRVQYVAEIIDFVVNENEYKDKNWGSNFNKIAWIKNNYKEYADNNKSASIVFLARNFNKIEPLPLNNFEVYKSYSYPRQDNLTPIVSESDIIVTLPTTIPLTSTSNMGINKSFPINQILYGPPGTGKTYHTINKAIAICNPSFNLNQERKLVKEEFDKLVKDGQIVFTTFHQSMSYEDFIEGIKPVMKGEEENEVGYEIQDGIFKIACANAAYNCYKAYKKDNKPTSTYSFDELYEAFIENIQSLMEAGTPPIFKTLTGKEITVIKITSTGSIKARAYNSVAKRNPAPLTKENLQKLYDKFETIDAIKNLKQVEETVEVTPRITEFYAVFKGLKAFEKEEFKPETDEAALDFITLEEKTKNFNERVYNRAIKDYGLDAEPVVLIIDEINRGNVSQIFGELITLIEDSKRLGNDEALDITLPYSKKKFGVPPNLYIIGTMNTADRSVEALDTALRRRFCFEEMMPNYEVLENKNIEGIALAELLKTINNRIEVLLDRDHTLGHSYFINVTSLEDLATTFKNNIIPLLQEYFYNDYGKIGLVLGKGFVRANAMTAKNDTSIFADFYTKNEIDIIKSYELIPFNEITDIKKACLLLLGKPTNTINELKNLEASVN